MPEHQGLKQYFPAPESFERHRLCTEILQRYDIRGIYNQTLTNQDAYVLGHALTLHFKKNTAEPIPAFLVGHDCRPSFPALKKALIAGITEAGGEVFDLGLAPTPVVNVCTLQQKVFDLPTSIVAGIIITASHNPAPYNGFKIMDNQGIPVCGAELVDLLNTNVDLSQITSQTRPVKEASYLLDKYLLYLLGHFKELHHLKNNKKYIWDTGHGVCGPLLEKLVPHLPGSHQIMNQTPDASFPDHTPDPSVEENMQTLKKAVIQEKADLGFSIDMDGDRLGVIDAKGHYWNGEKLSYLFADHLCQKQKTKIIVDVKSSQSILERVKDLGSEAALCPTGHALIKKLLKEQPEISFAGEYSGHHYFPHTYCLVDDAFFSALTVLDIDQHSTLSDTFQDLPSVYAIPQKQIHFPTHEDKQKAMKAVEQRAKTLNLDPITLDGIRLNFPFGWGLIRASNTEPALTYRAEAQTEKSLAEILSLMEKTLLETDS